MWLGGVWYPAAAAPAATASIATSVEVGGAGCMVGLAWGVPTWECGLVLAPDLVITIWREDEGDATEYHVKGTGLVHCRCILDLPSVSTKFWKAGPCWEDSALINYSLINIWVLICVMSTLSWCSSAIVLLLAIYWAVTSPLPPLEGY